MKIRDLAIPELKLVEPCVFSDDRGAFMETYNERTMAELGLPTSWVQDNYSISKRNVIRGVHYQLMHPQGKLVRVVVGCVRDVAVDLRKSSPNFGKYVAVELSDSNNYMFWIPPGFGHGFAALSDQVGIAYKTTDFYDPQGERTIRFDDPDIAIDWLISARDAIVSTKDREGRFLKDAEVFA